jgi:succinate-acetate transporter protein
VTGLPFAAQIDGYAWLVLAIATTLLTPAYLVGSSILFLGLIFADIAIWAVALMDLGIIGHHIGAPVAGWFLLFLGIIGIYLAGGVVLNTVFKKTILPLGKPLIKAG